MNASIYREKLEFFNFWENFLNSKFKFLKGSIAGDNDEIQK